MVVLLVKSVHSFIIEGVDRARYGELFVAKPLIIVLNSGVNGFLVILAVVCTTTTGECLVFNDPKLLAVIEPIGHEYRHKYNAFKYANNIQFN